MTKTSFVAVKPGSVVLEAIKTAVEAEKHLVLADDSHLTDEFNNAISTLLVQQTDGHGAPLSQAVVTLYAKGEYYTLIHIMSGRVDLRDESEPYDFHGFLKDLFKA